MESKDKIEIALMAGLLAKDVLELQHISSKLVAKVRMGKIVDGLMKLDKKINSFNIIPIPGLNGFTILQNPLVSIKHVSMTSDIQLLHTCWRVELTFVTSNQYLGMPK